MVEAFVERVKGLIESKAATSKGGDTNPGGFFGRYRTGSLAYEFAAPCPKAQRTGLRGGACSLRLKRRFIAGRSAVRTRLRLSGATTSQVRPDEKQRR